MHYELDRTGYYTGFIGERVYCWGSGFSSSWTCGRTLYSADTEQGTLEMTSSEIIEHLLEVKDQQSISDLKTLFMTADLVKFAKHAPMMNENDMNLVNAVDFINQTKVEEDPNVKKEPTEIRVEEKRSKQGRIALLCSISVVSIGVVVCLYLVICHIIDLFF